MKELFFPMGQPSAFMQLFRHIFTSPGTRLQICFLEVG